MKPETLGEVHILLSGLGEKLDEHIENSQNSYDKIMNSIEKLEKTCELTLQQALKTNGRVNLIEPLALDYQEKRARIRGGIILGTVFGASFLAFGAFALNAYINYKTEEVTNSAVKKLEEHYNIKIQ